MAWSIVIWAAGALFGAVGCGSSPSSSRPDRERPAPPDSGADLEADGPAPLPEDGGDGGIVSADADADAMPPSRDKINDRWAQFEDCLLTDLVLADEKLYALCEGNPHRLLECSLASEELEAADCDDFVRFEESPYLNDEPLTIMPLVHNVLNDRHSVVTFTSVPDNYPGFFVVDRVTREITDQRAWEAPGIRVGSDIIEFPSNLPWGASLLGDNLLIAARNRDFDAAEETYLGGMIMYFDWNSDGTVGIPAEAELGVAFRFTNGLNPTLIWPEGADMKLLHNSHRSGADPLDSGWDRITLGGEGNPVIDEGDFQSLGALSFEPFKHFSASPDGSALFLAALPNLYIYHPATNTLSDPLEWEDERVVSAAWAGAAGSQVFFAGASRAVYNAFISGGRPVSVSAGISLIGEPAASAADRSEGIYYQGLIIDEAAQRSAITTMLDSAFDVE